MLSAKLTEAEAYLVALIQDHSGIDLAEFALEDPLADNIEKIFRCWDFQYSWWRDSNTKVIDQCGRAVGKTASIIIRAWAFPIQSPGAEMVVTAPENVHLQPLISRIEDRLRNSRLTRELLPRRHGMGFTHRPFQADFVNGAKIIGRLPQRDGKGVKGLHPLRLEMDEGQDYPAPGWIELVETLKYGDDGAQWRVHGVSRGVRDEFFRHSQPGSGWSVHRITGMHRPSWSAEERNSKISQYGSRDSADYKRNILGVHGDATNPLFVMHRLMACVDDDDQSDYNVDQYYYRRISDEMINESSIEMLIDYPAIHKNWPSVWVGMDVGMTDAPSEILVMGDEKFKGVQEPGLRLLTRLHLQRVKSSDQRKIIAMLFDFYKPRLFSMDRGGLGLPVYQELQESLSDYMDRIVGYNADQKLVVGYDEYDSWEDPSKYEIKAVAKEYGYDLLRQYVDNKRFILPWDRELIGEWQGQTWTRETSNTSPYGKKIFSRGQFHTLDAAAMLVLGKELRTLTEMRKIVEEEPIPVMFV